jgi:hypothetical protein
MGTRKQHGKSALTGTSLRSFTRPTDKQQCSTRQCGLSLLLARAHTAYTGSENACWRAYLSSSGRGRPRAVSVSILVKFPVERKYACTLASRSNGCNSVQSSITLVGNQRSEKVMMAGAPGLRTRPGSRNTATGFIRYSTESVQITISNCRSAKGGVVSTLRSCMTRSASCALHAHRAARRVSEANNPGKTTLPGTSGSRPAPG